MRPKCSSHGIESLRRQNARAAADQSNRRRPLHSVFARELVKGERARLLRTVPAASALCNIRQGKRRSASDQECRSTDRRAHKITRFHGWLLLLLRSNAQAPPPLHPFCWCCGAASPPSGPLKKSDEPTAIGSWINSQADPNQVGRQNRN